MEIVYEDKFTSLEHYHLVPVIYVRDELVTVRHDTEQIFHLVHLFIEFTEAPIVQLGVSPQTPLSTAPVMTPVITCPWEVDPFGMAELVAHEVEVGLAAQAVG